MAVPRTDYRIGFAVNAAVQVVGVAGGTAWVAHHGWSVASVAMAWAILVLFAAIGEAAARYARPLHLRRIESIARRVRRVSMLASAGLVMSALVFLNQKSGLLAGIGTAAPRHLPLVVLLGASNEAIIAFVRWLAAGMIGLIIAGTLAVVTTASYWRFAPAGERARLHRGRAATATQDLLVVFGVPLAATTLAVVLGGRHAAILANALTVAALLSDMPFWISARLSRCLTVKTATRSLKWKIGSLLTLGLICASTSGSLVWSALGQGPVAAVAGLVAIIVVLVPTSMMFWRQCAVWTLHYPAHSIDRVQWITHLFVVALFLYPLSWARDLEVFKVHKLADILWSPRMLLTASMACAAAGLLYVLQTWLRRLDERAAR